MKRETTADLGSLVLGLATMAADYWAADEFEAAEIVASAMFAMCDDAVFTDHGVTDQKGKNK